MTSDNSPGGSDQAGPDVEALLGSALGIQYEVRRLLGRGGFAEVFEVWDRSLDRRLAVKVLRPDVAWTAGTLARFHQEARAVAKLAHPNILPIHFVGKGEGLVYYAMPFVKGESLGDRLRSQAPLDPEHAVTVIRRVLEALDHAHQQGFLHRDIKPDNVMLEGRTGRVLLMDFGIAKRVDAAGGLTQTGFVVGTPYYMSPEQALGQTDLDARSDLYSVGAMLFQMVTGTPPFEGDTSQEIVAKHISEPPPEPSSVNAQVPPWLSDVIVRCLAKRPADRFTSAAAVLRALESVGVSESRAPSHGREVAPNVAAQKTTPIATPGGAQGSSASVAQGRRRWLGGAVLLIVALVGGGGSVAFFLLRQPTLVVENRLVAPIQLRVEDVEYRLQAQSELRVSLPRRPSVVQWSLLQPTTPSGHAMGVAVDGAFSADNPRGTIRRAVDARPGGRPYFAPLITNSTGEALSVTVNPGLVAMQSCGCRIPGGMAQAMIGYYPLFSNSSVEVHDRLGRAASFQDVAARVDLVGGTVEIRIEDGDLR